MKMFEERRIDKLAPIETMLFGEVLNFKTVFVGLSDVEIGRALGSK